MPRVPRYEPQVQTQAMDAPRAQGVSPDAFGGGLARGLGAVANVAEDEARKQAELFNRAKFLEAVGMADREETELLDAPGGALTKTGNLAFGVTKPTLEQFDQRMSKIETGLESEDLRQAFTLYRLKKRNEAANRLNDHENRELIKYAEAKSSEVLASALDGVAVNADKPDVVESKISLGLGAIMTDPRIAGLPPEVLERKRQTWRQQVRTTVIDQLREDDAEAAVDYLEKHRDDFTEETADKLRDALRDDVAIQKGTRIADAAFADYSAGVPLGDVYKRITEESGQDPTLRKTARAEFDNQLREMETAKRAESLETSRAVLGEVVQAGGYAGISPSKLKASPNFKAFAAADPQGAATLIDRVVTENRQAADRTRIANDAGTKDQDINFVRLAKDPNVLRGANLEQEYLDGKLSRQQFVGLAKAQAELSRPEKEFKIKADAEAITETLAGMGVVEKDKPGIYSEVFTRLTLWGADQKEPPTQQQLVERAKSLVQQKVYKRGVFGINEGSMLETPETEWEVPVEVVQAAKNRGVTDAKTIREAYVRLTRRGYTVQEIIGGTNGK